MKKILGCDVRKKLGQSPAQHTHPQSSVPELTCCPSLCLRQSCSPCMLIKALRPDPYPWLNTHTHTHIHTQTHTHTGYGHSDWIETRWSRLPRCRRCAHRWSWRTPVHCPAVSYHISSAETHLAMRSSVHVQGHNFCSTALYYYTRLLPNILLVFDNVLSTSRYSSLANFVFMSSILM